MTPSRVAKLAAGGTDASPAEPSLDAADEPDTDADAPEESDADALTRLFANDDVSPDPQSPDSQPDDPQDPDPHEPDPQASDTDAPREGGHQA